MLEIFTNALIWIFAIYGLIEVVKTIYYICTYTKLESDGIYFKKKKKNQEDKIEAFMRSILFRMIYGKEDYINNVIVADLGSTDNTKKVIDTYKLECYNE